MKDFCGKVYRKLIGNKVEEKRYQKWIARHMQRLMASEKSWDTFEKKPLYSIVVPLYRTPEPFLRELVDSILAQTYPKWELILSDGSGEESPIADCLKELQKDKRIRVLDNREKLDISENTNRGLLEAKGDYIVFADHDDVLPPYALYECTKAICENGEPDLIYSDEDKITMDGKVHFQPHFKPDFNLTLLRSMNYFCHLVVVKKELQEKAGLLQAEYNGAQDYDFVLRCVEHAENICHIPEILYHWRSHAGSIAGSGSSKEYAFEAGRKAVAAHFKRCGIKAEVKKGELFGICRTRFPVEGKPLVSVIMSKRFEEAEIFNKAGYEQYEVIHGKNIKKANGEYLLFLDSGFRKASDGWMREMLSQAMQPGVGIVGAHIYQKNGKQQSAGVILGGKELVYRVAFGESKNSVGYFGRNTCAQEYSAADGICMMVSRKFFEDAGGFDPKLESPLADVDLCLKVRQNGGRVIYTPGARMLCEERGKKLCSKKEETYFREKWADFLAKGDPYYNPNQRLQKKLFRID